ncbi:MAG: hypothetical protein M3Z09_13415 [Acidobacteriota bacterium]|nr:hypothetical protein [Acidobacteriota bacterium]
MGSVRPIREESAPPVPFDSQAIDNLRFIRRAMESSVAFTAVPGKGGAAMGVSALIAAVLANRQTSPERWLAVWIAEAAVALGLGIYGARLKSQHQVGPSLARPARKFVVALLPSLLAGSLLTVILFRAGLWRDLPAAWLLIYGMGVLAGGVFSVRVVPIMGLCFLALGTCAVFTPPGWGNGWLALGFGAVQIFFGIVIARRFGG